MWHSFWIKLCIPLILLLCLQQLSLLEELAEELPRRFAADHHLQVCAHHAAFERNMRAAQAFLAERHPILDAEEAVGSLIEAWRPPEGCDPSGFELFQERNHQLPQDYPNWSFRLREGSIP